MVTYLRQARQILHDYQKQHLDLRANHLQSLADARLIAREPSLLDPEKTKKYEEKRAKESKRIIRKEANKQLHRKLGHILHPDHNNGGLSSVDIPFTSAPPYPIGPHPKTWTGPWQTVTDPTTITQHVSATNARQYNQAYDIPFGQEPLQSYVGYNGDQPGAQLLIQGQLPPKHIMSKLLPEIQALL